MEGVQGGGRTFLLTSVMFPSPVELLSTLLVKSVFSCYTHFYFIRTTFFGATVGVLKFLSGFTVVKNSFVLSDFGVTVKSFLIFVLNFFSLKRQNI